MRTLERDSGFRKMKNQIIVVIMSKIHPIWEQESGMTFRQGSHWSLENELRCLLIFKQLEEAGWVRGLQARLCGELASQSPLGVSTIQRKVSDYKGLAGFIKATHRSNGSAIVYKTCGALDSGKISQIIETRPNG